VQTIAERFQGARVEPSFGSSSALARQIRDGAPADVFLSANREWVDFLREEGAVAGDPIVLARNRLVCIATRGGAVSRESVNDPRSLLVAIGEDGRVAIADEGVPAGEYARAALRHLGLLSAFTPHLVGQQDVRAVLNAVELGELAVGFVYSTDAKVADVVTLFELDPSTHPPIEVRAAVVRDARQPELARRFLDFLRGDTARSVLAEAGFALP
jgi:molybdate transport system substrate-binding protein